MTLFDLPNARPQTFPIKAFMTGETCAYGVRVRFGNAAREITSFATGDEAWEAGVEALCAMIEEAA